MTYLRAGPQYYNLQCFCEKQMYKIQSASLVRETKLDNDARRSGIVYKNFARLKMLLIRKEIAQEN